MKIKNISKIFLAILAISMLFSCKKEADSIFTMFEGVTVTFKNSDPRTVVDYKEVNDNSEVWVDFTINSANEDMYTVTVERTTATGFDRSTVFTLTDGQRRSFSNVYKYLLQRDGKTSFRVYARNQKGVYIGDGYTKVTVEGKASHTLYANRVIYLPDTTAKVLPSFISLAKGQTFSYSNGKANSADIDFGVWRRYEPSTSNPTLAGWVYNMYAIGSQPAAFNIYDVTTWDKRTTKFSAQVTGGSAIFLNTLVSGSTIETAAKARTINLTAITGTTVANGLTAGNIIYFQTPDLKYGAMLINSITTDLERKPLINVSIKLQN